MELTAEAISGSRCKFRVAFDRDLTVDDFKDLQYKRITQDGRLFTITSLDDADKLETKLKAMSPVLVEKFPLSLEEIFLDEMEGEGYDFSEIFS